MRCRRPTFVCSGTGYRQTCRGCARLGRRFMVKRDEYAEAAERGQRMLAAPTAAVSARYDRLHQRIVVGLRSGLEISFSPKDAQGLERATPAQLSEIEITPMRDGLLWPQLDAD